MARLRSQGPIATPPSLPLRRGSARQINPSLGVERVQETASEAPGEAAESPQGMASKTKGGRTQARDPEKEARRRRQNRDAQRHARQRKSDYLQTLEQHVQAHETLAREIQAENAALRCIIEEQKATLARLFAGPSPTYVTLDTPALSSLWTPLSPSVTSSATETPVSAFTSPASSYSPLPCIAPSDCIASTAYDRMSAPDGTRRASGGPYSQLADAFLGLMPPPSPILRPVELPPMWSSAPPMGSFSPLALPTPHCWQGDGLGLDVAPSPSSNWFS